MHNKKYPLTIVSVSYNNFESIKLHIDSIIQQDYENYELIFQDDGSDAYNYGAIKKLMSAKFMEDHNVKFFHNSKNVGTVKNLNLGIEHASGEIVMPIACDDFLYDKHVLSRFINEFKDPSCNICCCSVIQEKSRIIFPDAVDVELITNGSTRALLDRMYASNCISGALLTVRKSFFTKQHLFDTRFVLVEDYPTFLYMIKKGEKIRFIKDICLVHGENGISNRFTTLFNRNKIATQDSKLIKDIYVMPYVGEVKNIVIRRYIIACYYLRYSKNAVEFIVKFAQYLDIWIKVISYYLLHKNRTIGIYYYLKEFDSKNRSHQIFRVN